MNKTNLIKALSFLSLFSIPLIISNPYYGDVLIIYCIFVIYALSLDLLLGYTGIISFGHASFFGLGAYASAIMTLKLHLSYWLGLLIAVGITAVVAFLIGSLTLRKLKGIYFAIVSFAITQVFRFLVVEWETVTNGAAGIASIPPPEINLIFEKIAFKSEQSYLFIVIAFVILVTLSLYRVVNSGLGRAFLAIREGEDLARSIGIDTCKYKKIALVISAIIAAISGSLYGHYISAIGPRIFSLHYVSLPLIIVIVGGKGTLLGAFIGAALFFVLPEFLGFKPEMKMVIFGLLLLMSIIYMPDGIASKLGQIRDKFFVKNGEIKNGKVTVRN